MFGPYCKTRVGDFRAPERRPYWHGFSLDLWDAARLKELPTSQTAPAETKTFPKIVTLRIHLNCISLRGLIQTPIFLPTANGPGSWAYFEGLPLVSNPIGYCLELFFFFFIQHLSSIKPAFFPPFPVVPVAFSTVDPGKVEENEGG